MTYALNKILGGMLSPTGVTVAVLGAAVLLGFLGKARPRCRAAGAWLAALALGWFWFWGSALAVVLVGAPLEKPYLDARGMVPAAETFPEADAILVLGGGMAAGTNYSPYAEMRSGADRVWQGARLYRAGKAKKVLLSGGESAASSMGLLEDLGVPRGAVECEEKPMNTEEEARRMAERGVRKVLLVTSAWHMRRAELMFRKYAPGIEVLPAPADWEATQRLSDLKWHNCILPTADTYSAATGWFREVVGYWGYRLFR